MTEAFLLAMQAAGMVVDYVGTQSQIKQGRKGLELDNAALDLNLTQVQLESEESSLDSMKRLRQNLGTQAAILAARGTRSSGGNAVGLLSESLNNYNSDQRVRRMNLLGKEAGLRANKILSGMHQLTSETQLGQSLTKRFFNTIPTSPTAWKSLGQSLGGSSKPGGFGLTPKE